MKRLTPIALAVLCLGAQAQQTPGIQVDETSVQTPSAGTASLLQQNTDEVPAGDGSCLTNHTVRDCGQMRTTCNPSHQAPDDPLINNTVETMIARNSHWHQFYGSIGTNYLTDIAVSPQTAAENSTCRGGIGNRTRYWHPALMNIITGKIIKPSVLLVYYKSSRLMAFEINVFPTNLRMLAGDSNRSTPLTSNTIVHYICVGTTSPGNTKYLSIPETPCPAGNELWPKLSFPQCIAVDGEDYGGSLSGTLTTDWRLQPTTSAVLVARYMRDVGNQTDIVITPGSGVAAPTTDYRQGTSDTFEYVYITMPALTEGQTMTVGGRTFTAGPGGNTAIEVAKALGGGDAVVDSADHKSHLAYTITGAPYPTGTKSERCPDTHPYGIPEIVYVPQYAVNATNNPLTMRWVSDRFKGRAGATLHGDFGFGWTEEMNARFTKGNLHKGLDGHAHLLGCVDANGVEGQCKEIKLPAP